MELWGPGGQEIRPLDLRLRINETVLSLIWRVVEETTMTFKKRDGRNGNVPHFQSLLGQGYLSVLVGKAASAEGQPSWSHPERIQCQRADPQGEGT